MKAKLDFFSHAGEVAALMRAVDWHSTSLGPPEQWPQLLTYSLRLVLSSKHPMFLWWGQDLLQFYNDAYRESLGPSFHPDALAQPARTCHGEYWPLIGAQVESIMAGGNAAWQDSQPVLVSRRGSRELAWWSYNYTPVEDHNGVQGLLALCKDVTAEHQLREELHLVNTKLLIQAREREQLERCQAFQLELFDRMGAASTPDEVASVAFEMLSNELGVTRVHFAHIDCEAETYHVEYAWSRADMVSLKGQRGSLADLGTEIVGNLRQGRILAVSDIMTDPRLSTFRAAYQTLNTRALINVPVLKNGSLIAVISLHKDMAYEWKTQEIFLLEEVAQRICTTLERARSENFALQFQQVQLTRHIEETEFLRRLFQQAPSFIAILRGPDHRFEIANDAYLQTVGYRQVIGKTVREALPELEEQGYVELLDFVYRTGKPYIAKGRPVRVQRRAEIGPEELFFNFVYQPIFENDRTVSGIFIEGSDVTEQQQAQRKEHFLLELADKLRPLSTPESIISAATEHVGSYLRLSRVLFAEVNHEKESFHILQDWMRDGMKSAVGMTKSLDDFGTELINTLRAGQIVTINDAMSDPRCADRTSFYTSLGAQAYLTIPLVKNGKLEFILCLHKKEPYRWTEHDRQVAQEMAERTWAAVESARAQAELSVVRDQSMYVFNTMTEGFGIVDSDWTILQMNAEGLRIRQMQAEQVIGRNHWEVFPELVGTELAATYERVKTTRIAETCETSHAGPDGKTIWMEVRTYPARDGGLAFFFRDISIRKEFEHKLKDADRRKDEFVAMLAHELRNPLAPISAAADLMQMAQLDPESLVQTSEIIGRQVRHMTSLINDLMDVSRVTRGLITLEKAVLDADQIVADALEQVGPLIASRRHHLTVHLPSEPAFVHGDQKRLVQVLANVLSNSAKYTLDGGEIALTVEMQDGYVLFTVADNGIGMTKEMLGRVFELFAQAQRTSDRAQGGLGIGLALVKSLVELHDGTVLAHSKGVGQGSTFTIRLPCSGRQELPREQPRESLLLPASRRLRLMVVDDNEDAARTLALFLKTAGHEVTVENHPEKALERACVDVPDVFLLDIGLPGMDGNELARRLRSCSKTANAALIAVTGYGQEQDRENTMKAGFDHHFVKPVDTERLSTVLASLSNAATG